MRSLIGYLLAFATMLVPHVVEAKSSVQENRNQVESLNAFADELLTIVAHWGRSDGVKTTERISGYSGMPAYFREVEYLDSASGRLLARVRWINKTPDLAQMIELFMHDGQGKLVADYYVSYLADYRNAPMYALINLHQTDSDLGAFRQFDLFGDILFEQCRGEFFGEKVDFSIDSFDPAFSADNIAAELYASCFGFLPLSLGKYTHPVNLVPGLAETKQAENETDDFVKMEARIAELDQLIASSPDNAKPHLERGKINFLLQRMGEAVDDFTRALQLNDGLDAAYFGRGMALGRLDRLKEGIADLTQFINRNPESSIGYTKRGVRRIWNKDFKGATEDLKMAIFFDNQNAEAYDDLGVALAQTGKSAEAIDYFRKARTIDPTYLKAHHNLGMALYIVGDLQNALGAVDDALDLAPNTKDTLLLKSTILEGMGRTKEAQNIRGRAEFLPDGNWSERSAIQ